MICKVSVQGISNPIQLERDLDNTRGKNRRKTKSKLKGKRRTPELNKQPLIGTILRGLVLRVDIYDQALRERTDVNI